MFEAWYKCTYVEHCVSIAYMHRYSSWSISGDQDLSAMAEEFKVFVSLRSFFKIWDKQAKWKIACWKYDRISTFLAVKQNVFGLTLWKNNLMKLARKYYDKVPYYLATSLRKYFIKWADNILTIADQSGKLSKCSNVEDFTFKLWIAPPWFPRKALSWFRIYLFIYMFWARKEKSVLNSSVRVMFPAWKSTVLYCFILCFHGQHKLRTCAFLTEQEFKPSHIVTMVDIILWLKNENWDAIILLYALATYNA